MTRKKQAKQLLAMALVSGLFCLSGAALAAEIPTIPTPDTLPAAMKTIADKVLGVELAYSQQTKDLEDAANQALETKMENNLRNGVEVKVVMGMVNANGLKVRALPNPKSPVIGHFQYLDNLIIMAKDGKWYQVKYGDGYGWVYAPYIIDLEDNAIILDPEEETDYVTLDELNAADIDQSHTTVVKTAKSCLGKPYRYGAAGPNAFDCSGLVTYAYQKVGVSVPRTSQSYYSVGKAVSASKAQAGDIVCFSSRGNTITHVGIYIGDGQFIHAATGNVNQVSINSLNEAYYKGQLVSIRHLL